MNLNTRRKRGDARKALCIVIGLILALGLVTLVVAPFSTEPDSIIRSPTAHSGKWSDGGKAFSSDNSYAWTSTHQRDHTFWGYGFDSVLGANDKVVKVEVGIEAYTTDNEKIQIRVSWDGGDSWSGVKTYDPLPTSDPNTVTWFDFTDVIPGNKPWTVSELSDAKFRVEVTYLKDGGEYPAYLDWIPVRVTYMPSAAYVTFSQTGVSSDFTGTVLTVDGSGYVVGDLPKTFTWVIGTTHNFEYHSPLNVGNGKRYVWVNTEGLSTLRSGSIIVPSGGGTVTAHYKTQYYLTVGTVPSGIVAIPGEGWYDEGGEVTLTAPQYVPSEAGEDGVRYRFDYWDVDGVSQGYGVNQITVTMDSSHTAVARYVLQYYLTVDTNPDEVLTLNPSAVSGEGWYDAGATAIVNAVQTVCKAGGESRYEFRGWTGATPTGVGNEAEVYMDGPKTATANYQLQYRIIFDQSGVGIDFTGTVVEIDGTGYGVADLPEEFWWDEGSTHSFAFQSPLVVGAGKQYVWVSTIGLSTVQSDQYFTVTASGSIIGNYKIQYRVTVTAYPEEAQGGEFNVTYTQCGTEYTSIETTPWSEWVDAGTTVTVSEPQEYVPSEAGEDGVRYRFDHYDPSDSVEMDEAKTITLIYKTQYYLTVNSYPEGITTPSGSGWYDADTYAYISTDEYVYTAPDTRYRFVSWVTDDMTEIGNPIDPHTTVRMDRAKTVTASYVVQYYLKVKVYPEGLVYIGGEGWYDNCTYVTLEAPGVVYYRFDHWDVDGVSQGYGVNPITVHMDAPHTATAYYTRIVTRTQGFWATHYNYTWSVWEGVDDKSIGTKTIDNEGKLFGAFWSSIPYKSNGARRTLLDQARMQLLQQLVAAILNVEAFGDDDKGTGAGLIAQGRSAFAGTDRAQILNIAKALEAFNKSGDAEPLPPGVIPGPADPRMAQAKANRAFWDSLP